MNFFLKFLKNYHFDNLNISNMFISWIINGIS